MKKISIDKYSFFLDEEMENLIAEGLVQVMTYEDDGDIPARPFVEIQSDLEKTDADHTCFVDKFESYEEANKCAEVVAGFLKIPFLTIQTF